MKSGFPCPWFVSLSGCWESRASKRPSNVHRLAVYEVVVILHQGAGVRIQCSTPHVLPQFPRVLLALGLAERSPHLSEWLSSLYTTTSAIIIIISIAVLLSCLRANTLRCYQQDIALPVNIWQYGRVSTSSSGSMPARGFPTALRTLSMPDCKFAQQARKRSKSGKPHDAQAQCAPDSSLRVRIFLHLSHSAHSTPVYLSPGESKHQRRAGPSSGVANSRGGFRTAAHSGA